MPITPTTFSAQLQKLRKDRKVTQEQLAAHLGVSSQAVSKWENGSYPDGDLLPKIADFFDVSIDYLYGRADRDVPVTQQIINELQGIRHLSIRRQYYSNASCGSGYGGKSACKL